MKLTDISLFLSCSSTFALTIPEERLGSSALHAETKRQHLSIPERRNADYFAHVPREVTPPTGAQAPGLAKPSTETSNSVPAAASFRKPLSSNNISAFSNYTRLSQLAYFQAPIDLCDYGIIDCPAEENDDTVTDSEDDDNQPPFNGTASHNVTSRVTKRSRLGKRGSPRKFTVWDGFDIRSVPYFDSFRLDRGPRAGKVPRDTFDYQDPQDMGNAKFVNLHNDKVTFRRVVEHPIEEQTIPDELRYMGGNDATTKAKIETLYKAKITSQGITKLKDKMPWITKLKNPTWGEVLWHAGGSSTHPVPNVIAEKAMNGRKEAFWAQKRLKDPNELKTLREQVVKGEVPANRLLSFFRMVIGMGHYMNHADIVARFKYVYDLHAFMYENAEALTGVKVVDGTGAEVNLGDLHKKFTKEEADARETFLNEYVKEYVSQDTIKEYDEAIANLDKEITALSGKAEDEDMKKTLAQEYNAKLEELRKLKEQQEELWKTIVKVDADVEQAAFKDMQKVRTDNDWDDLTTTQWKELSDEITEAEDNLQSVQTELDKLSADRLEQFRKDLELQQKYIKDAVKEIHEVVTMPDITAPVAAGLETDAHNKLIESRDLLAGKLSGTKRPLDDIETEEPNDRATKKQEKLPDLGLPVEKPQEDQEGMTDAAKDALREDVGLKPTDDPGRTIPFEGTRPSGEEISGLPEGGLSRTGGHRV